MTNEAAIKASSEYKSWRNVVKRAELLDTNALLKEAKELHKNRTSRNLIGKKIGARRLAEADGIDISARARLTEMNVQAKYISYNLYAANQAMIDWLLSKNLIRGGTVADRKAGASDVVKRGIQLAAKLDGFVDIIDYIIADIDAAGWSKRRMIDAIQLASKPEIGI